METEQWEINYKNGLEINRYPFDVLISFWFRNKHLIKKDNNEKFKICELGCGCGNNLAFFAENDCEVYGIDISPTAIKHAKELFKNKKLKGNFQVGNIINHTFENNYFDLVIDRGCFSHNPTIFTKLIDVAYNIMKKNSLFFSQCHFNDDTRLEKCTKVNNNKYICNETNSAWFNLPLFIFDENEINNLFGKKFKIINFFKCKTVSKDNFIFSHIDIHLYKEI